MYLPSVDSDNAVSGSVIATKCVEATCIYMYTNICIKGMYFFPVAIAIRVCSVSSHNIRPVLLVLFIVLPFDDLA